jgi:hypothetical protein
MYSFKNIIFFFIFLFFLGGCSSNEVTPIAAIVQPKTLTIVTFNEVNPTNISYTWKDNLITSFVVKTLNTATNQDFVRQYDITRNDKKLIQSILYTYQGGGFSDGNTVQNYTYNADNTQINYLSTTWTYNKLGNLSNLIYGSRSISGFVEYSYNEINQLTKMHWKEGAYLDNTNTINSLTNTENPLYNITKSIQFLNVTINNTDLTMSSLSSLPKSYNNGLVDNFVTYEVDAQNRANSITISNNGIVLKKYTLTY